jgi:hypothetical protein
VGNLHRNATSRPTRFYEEPRYGGFPKENKFLLKNYGHF